MQVSVYMIKIAGRIEKIDFMNSNQSLAEDLVLRRERLQSAMQRQNTEACILTSSINIFYLTGVIYAGYLYVPVTGNPIHFVKRPFGLSLADTVAVQKPEQIPDALKNMGLSLPTTVLLETDVLSWNNCLRLLHALGLAEAGNASALLRTLRQIKTSYEIGMTRKNARQHEKVYEAVPSLYQKGMTDIGLQGEFGALDPATWFAGYFQNLWRQYGCSHGDCSFG